MLLLLSIHPRELEEEQQQKRSGGSVWVGSFQMISWLACDNKRGGGTKELLLISRSVPLESWWWAPLSCLKMQHQMMIFHLFLKLVLDTATDVHQHQQRQAGADQDLSQTLLELPFNALDCLIYVMFNLHSRLINLSSTPRLLVGYLMKCFTHKPGLTEFSPGAWEQSAAAPWTSSHDANNTTWIKAQMVQQPAKYYQKVEALSQQAALVSQPPARANLSNPPSSLRT